MRLLKPADKKKFYAFLSARRRLLSPYLFENIFSCKALYEIRWSLIRGALCIFFKDKAGCFLFLPPLGGEQDPAVTEEVFRIMDRYNTNRDLSRIENAAEEDAVFYRRQGYRCYQKSCDYVYLREDLAGLKGNPFKSKRASCNYFTGHYEFEYLPYNGRFRRACLGLYESWRQRRWERSRDPVYRGMLEDSGLCLAALLKDFRKLDAAGRVIVIGGEVKGFTVGAALNTDTFCVLYEVTDLGVKGLAQFIFRRFCQELRGFRYINVMDDSGLENLKEVKLSYRPAALVSAYNITRKHGQ
ncbi:MAG: phosphatidylglycerol lysyltransferase domain-containing protein [Candidatus Omnitrophica bacterium]|nr:phosphatidylglycerol lysyltransferase domain-containing protein [Candidatus Omnitrophota bacterium]